MNNLRCFVLGHRYDIGIDPFGCLSCGEWPEAGDHRPIHLRALKRAAFKLGSAVAGVGLKLQRWGIPHYCHAMGEHPDRVVVDDPREY